jgi:hypothetical protein
MTMTAPGLPPGSASGRHAGPPGASALVWCPRCGSQNLRAVTGGEVTNVLCRECGCCWHVEPAVARLLDPRACPGCPSRPTCLRRLWEAREPEPLSGCSLVESGLAESGLV